MSKTKWYQKPTYLLVALALVLSLGVVALPMAGTAEASPDNWYVDGASGTDDGSHGTGPGTSAFKTIQYAINDVRVVNGDTINVAAGTYNESITLKDGVEVLGAGADVTTIDGGGSGSVVTADNVGSGTKLDGFTITNGTASNGGGMNITNNASPVISNCIFDGNSAGSGGGMYNEGSSPTVTDCIFSGNSATGRGGGMHNEGSSPTVTDCIFDGNSADSYGGGMCNWGYSSPTVTNCIFDGNSSPYGGGMSNRSFSSPTVANCIFSGNLADSDGGGMYNRFDSSPTVTNCIFEGNSATDDGGGMYNNDSSPTVTNCIFHGNSADNGGGMSNEHSSSPSVTNCIISSNTALEGGGICAYNSTPIIDYNDVWNNTGGDYYGCSAGANDISQDPMFVNPSAQDFHSKPGSPCIDAGTNDGAPSRDMDGNHRPIDGDGDGVATTDMGAYEYMPPPPVGGEAYPVNKLAILAPWIALAVLLAGGTGWFTLRRRRAQS